MEEAAAAAASTTHHHDEVTQARRRRGDAEDQKTTIIKGTDASEESQEMMSKLGVGSEAGGAAGATASGMRTDKTDTGGETNAAVASSMTATAAQEGSKRDQECQRGREIEGGGGSNGERGGWMTVTLETETAPLEAKKQQQQQQPTSSALGALASSSSGSSTPAAAPFSMKLQTSKRPRLSRKRKLGQGTLSGSAGAGGGGNTGSITGGSVSPLFAASSSSSSGDDESSSEEDYEMLNNNNSGSNNSMMSSSNVAENEVSLQQQQQQYQQQHRSSQQQQQQYTNTKSSSSSPRGTTSQQQQHHEEATASSSSDSNTSSSSQLPQPEGWRVKLYRLNADGSWDDCGTGRIVCLYRQQQQQSAGSKQGGAGAAENAATSSENNTSATNKQASSSKTASSSASNNNPNSNTAAIGSDQWLYQETGEATLCVHAEVTKLYRQPRVLLRTRILLRDAYQRQGDNIITWCEPYYGGSGGSGSNSSNNNNSGGGGGANKQQLQQHGGSYNSGKNASGSGGGVDLALSFQDNAGCLDIWRQITGLQQRAAELVRQQQQHNSTAGLSTAQAVAAQHHADLQRQQHQELWAHLNSSNSGADGDEHHHTHSSLDDPHFGNGLADPSSSVSLPNPPTMANLEEIADTIAALQHTQQREHLSMWIAKDECSYLKLLLALFPAAESKGDYGKLATLAACVKTVLLMNDPSILDLIVTVAAIFEQVCSCLEYDPDLREKANHRWFLRERAKFRTVVHMEDPELVSAIHRSFRVNYLRDTLLRPTMDESALSTLSSLQTFTHADVVKGVMMSGAGKEVDLKDSYLVRVIRMLGVELHTLSGCEWNELGNLPPKTSLVEVLQRHHHHHHHDEFLTDPSIVVGKHSLHTTTWKQYLAPQDRSLASRRLRKRGCLSFLRELFNMVRVSLQPCDKDSFFPVICTLAIDLNEDREIPDNASQTSQIVEVGSVASTVRSSGLDDKTEPITQGVEVAMPSTPVTLLSVLGSVLSDHNSDVSEKSSVLEIISGIAMHDPSLIRHCCLEFHDTWKKERANASGGGISERPEANEKKQIIFFCPPNDLLASLLFLLDVETDAGVLLQVSEIMRIILDTDMMGDHGSIGAGFADEAEGIPPGSGQTPLHDQHNQPSGMAATSTDQKQFLSLFYEHYVEWLVAPFQFTVLHPVRRVPSSVLLSPDESPLLQNMLGSFRKGIAPDDPLLITVPPCAIRSSFTVELLSFCVRAHLYRMKFFLLKSRVLGNVLKLLRPHPSGGISGDRCLKLAALRFLRAILSVNDEFYYRHIIQHDLFAPVFEAFRANPVGDNLVSSAIVEMCDYIHSENIKSLLEYIVTKHLLLSGNTTAATAQPEKNNSVPSLEDVSSPYVSTLTVLRQAYEANLKNENNPAPSSTGAGHGSSGAPASPGGSRYFGGAPGPEPSSSAGGGPSSMVPSAARHQLIGKALEDQRKFHAADLEESYFDADDDEEPPPHHHRAAAPVSTTTAAVDEVEEAQHQQRQQQHQHHHHHHHQGGGDAAEQLHRTPRMFSLASAHQQASSSSPTTEDTNDLTGHTTAESPPPSSMNDERAPSPVVDTNDTSSSGQMEIDEPKKSNKADIGDEDESMS